MNPDVEAASMELLLHLVDSKYLEKLEHLARQKVLNFLVESVPNFQNLDVLVQVHLILDEVVFHLGDRDQQEGVVVEVLCHRHFHPCCPCLVFQALHFHSLQRQPNV